jgi:hypothetical protein
VLADLYARGLVRFPDGDLVALTKNGHALASERGYDRGRPETPEELHEAWLAMLPEWAGRAAEALISAHPDGLSTSVLALKAGGSSATSGTAKRPLRALEQLGIMARPSPGRTVLEPTLLLADG